VKTNNKSQQWLATAGIVAPILYITVAVTMGILEPGYSHQTMMMSVLGGVIGLRGIIFNLGVGLTGALLIAFGLGLHRGINQGKGKKGGLVLIFLAALGLMGAAFFSCNEGCTNVIQEPDMTGQLHMLFAFISGLTISFSPIPFYFRLKKDPQWNKFKGITLAASILSNIPGIIFWITLFTTRLPEWEGLIQRLGLVFALIWVEVMSIKLLQLSKKGK
jgi:hypothetical membrane protein